MKNIKMKIISMIFVLSLIVTTTNPITFAYQISGNQREYLRTVAYVPLDDRPVNYDRVIMAGQAMGIKILVPENYSNPAPNLFSTKLDGQPKNTTGTNLGSPDLIIKWLEDVTKANAIDAYIISADMISSGGLVGSRLGDEYHKTNDVNTVINRFKTIMTKIVKDKPVYVFDTVMRLASTTGFNGYQLEEYNNTRNYGLKARKSYTTVNNIINNYNTDSSGKQIKSSDYKLTDKQVKSYISARTRKFKINVELHNLLSKYRNAYYVYGIDDSGNSNTIQTNEISYLKRLVGENRVFAGADEIATNLLSRYAVETYSKWGLGRKPNVSVTYFGDGKNLKADAYDNDTLETSVNKHILLSGGNIVSKNSDLDILILTKQQNTSIYQSANNLNSRISNNLTLKKPTVVIDASGQKSVLSKLLYSNTSIPSLLSYSSWNTAGNMVGLGVGHGIGRLSFIGLGDKGVSTNKTSLVGQVKLLFTEFAVDVSYQVGSKSIIDNESKKIFNARNNDFIYNFYTNNAGFNSKKYSELRTIASNYIGKSQYNEFSLDTLAYKFFGHSNKVYKTYKSSTDCSFAKINWINYASEAKGYEIDFPWRRTFEIRVPLNVSFK